MGGEEREVPEGDKKGGRMTMSSGTWEEQVPL